MFSWLSRLRRQESAVLGFGKVPAWPEYLRCGVRGDVAGELENWLAKASEWGATHRGDVWKDLRASFPLQFVLRSIHTDAVVTGVIVPSADSVGRQFPLTIAAVVPVRGAGSTSHVAPLAFATFLEAAARELPRAAAASSPKDFASILDDLQPPTFEDSAEHVERYDAWAARKPLRELLRHGLGDAEVGPSTLHTILEATSPFRGTEAPPTALSVRLPVGPEPFTTCFWLHVVRIACRWKDTVPGYFAGPSDVLVQLGGTASPSALADSWAPDDRSKYVCVPTGDTSRYATPFPEELSEVLASESAMVSDLLSAM